MYFKVTIYNICNSAIHWGKNDSYLLAIVLATSLTIYELFTNQIKYSLTVKMKVKVREKKIGTLRHSTKNFLFYIGHLQNFS